MKTPTADDSIVLNISTTSPRRSFVRAAGSLALGVTMLTLAGCYVVPLQADGRPYQGNGAPAAYAPVAPVNLPVPASPSVVPVRMYPSNDAAAPTGAVAGSVTSYTSGRGDFQFIRAGETFAGEATRYGGQKNGVANAAGTRGGYANCQYSMNNSTQGTGICKFSDGSTYTLHVGQ
jgi:hypothetical protein